MDYLYDFLTCYQDIIIAVVEMKPSHRHTSSVIVIVLARWTGRRGN